MTVTPSSPEPKPSSEADTVPCLVELDQYWEDCRGRGEGKNSLITGHAHVGVGVAGVSGQDGADKGANRGAKGMSASRKVRGRRV